jgi:hypothetical protein
MHPFLPPNLADALAPERRRKAELTRLAATVDGSGSGWFRRVLSARRRHRPPPAANGPASSLPTER